MKSGEKQRVTKPPVAVTVVNASIEVLGLSLRSQVGFLNQLRCIVEISDSVMSI